jgi:hypothetical protein
MHLDGAGVSVRVVRALVHSRDCGTLSIRTITVESDESEQCARALG